MSAANGYSAGVRCCAGKKNGPIPGKIEPLVGEAEIFPQAAAAISVRTAGRSTPDDNGSISICIDCASMDAGGEADDRGKHGTGDGEADKRGTLDTGHRPHAAASAG